MKPKILFKGFEDDVWISSQFEEIFELIKNNSLSRAELSSEGRIGNIHYGDVLVKYGECLDTSSDSITYIHNDEIGEDLYRRGALKSGDIIFADAAEDNTVGKCSELICNDEEQIVSGLHTIACRPKIEITKRYLGYYLNSNAYHNQLLPHIQGTKVSSISRKAIVTTSIVYPFAQRVQELIATYFYRLDNLISTSTSRLASLKQVKEASLQAMFPQKGETVPKIRFKGFEGEWEEVKLKDISTKVIEKNRLNNISITLTNSAEYGIINQRDFFDHDVSNTDNVSGYFIVQPNDFVYNPRISTLAPVGPINMNKLGYAGVVSPLYYVFRVTGFNKSFLDIYFHTNVWHKFMKDNGNTGARFDRLSISNELFYEMPIYCPRDENEQQQIASYFTSLDKQIALQTQRLEKLRQIKAACLDKMFV